MKRIAQLLIVTLLLQAMAPAYARAGESPPSKEELEATLKYMKANHMPYLETSFANMVQGYFLWRLEDYSKLVKYQGETAIWRSLRAAEWEKRWFDLEAEMMLASTDKFFDYARELRSLTYYAEHELVLARQLKSDFDATRAAWKDRCSDSTLEYAYSYFNPDNLFPIDKVDITPQAGSYTVGFSVTSDFSGQMQSGEAVGYSDTDAAIITTSYAVGATIAAKTAVGAYVATLVGSSLAVPVVGAVAALIAITVISFINNAARAKAINEQWAMHEEIGNLQRKNRSDLTARSHTYINDQCGTILKLADEDLERVGVYVNQYEQYATALHAHFSSAFEDLKQAHKDQLQALVDSYWPFVQANYLGSIDKAFQDRIERAKEANEYRLRYLLPRLKLFEKSANPLDRLQVAHEAWDIVIAGDARLVEGDGFSFGANTSGDVSNSAWKSTVKYFKAKVGL